jgi:hypothetical protein
LTNNYIAGSVEPVKISQITLRVDESQLSALDEISSVLGTDRTVVLRSLIGAAADSFRLNGSISMPFRLVAATPNEGRGNTVESQWESFTRLGDDIIPLLTTALEEE